MTTILVVDDDPAASHLTRMWLTTSGYTVESASNGEETLRVMRGVRPDLVILDLMLAGPTVGWETCRRLREDSNVPIIILGAGGDEVDKVVGLELGADDCITRPFNPRELVARVRAVLRRSNANRSSRGVLAVADVRVDPDRYEVTIGGQTVALPPKELRLLAILARNPGVVVPRERLLQLVWPRARPHTSRALDVHISWLRQKLRESSVRIVRVWGIGYRLVVTTGSSPGPSLADLTRP
jgi:DNA-binding response OmpR family regulator